MLVRLVQRLVLLAWVRTRGRPALEPRDKLPGDGGVCLLLALAWIPPPANYQPISPSAHGTIPESFDNAGLVLTSVVRLAPPLRALVPPASASPGPSSSASPGSVASPSPADSPGASPCRAR